MNSEIKGLPERIRFSAERAGGGNKLSQKTGIPRSTLETYITGTSEPQVTRLVAIAKAAGVDIGWLATGDGSQLQGAPDANRLRLALEAVEEGLAAAQRVMAPDKKAELILAAYDLLAEAKEETKAQIIRFVRAA